MSLPTRDPASPSRLIHGHFFFVDIVGLSDPSMSTKTQTKKIEVLNQSISETEVFKSTSKESMLILHTGDGMCIGFLQGPELPLHIAAELQQKLTEYNTGKIPSETVRVRIGLHSGTCYYVKDIKGVDNIWGPGIILARRVMDFGDDGHILLTPRLAEDLRELSDDYRKIIQPVHDYKLKHNQNILVYSAFGDGFGNPKPPTRGTEIKSQFGEEILKMQKTTLYPFVEVNLTVLDPIKMIVQHKRTYEITNRGKQPINHVVHGIATDVEMHSFDDLNIQVYDKLGKNLKISNINMNKPTVKEFTTKFSKPIAQDESDQYTLVYEVEEPQRYFENAFLTDVEKFNLNFKFSESACKCNPVIYEINQEMDEKRKSDIQPSLEKYGDHIVARFSREENHKGDTIRLEW